MHALHADQLDITGCRRTGNHSHGAGVGDTLDRLGNQLHHGGTGHHADVVVGHQGDGAATLIGVGVQEDRAGLCAGDGRTGHHSVNCVQFFQAQAAGLEGATGVGDALAVSGVSRQPLHVQALGNHVGGLFTQALCDDLGDVLLVRVEHVCLVVNEAVDEHLNGLLFGQLADAAVVTYGLGGDGCVSQGRADTCEDIFLSRGH